MNDSIILKYNLKNPVSWDEEVELSIPLQDISEYMQITKTLTAMITLFTKIGYNIESVSDGYLDIATQLEEATYREDPTYNSSDDQIDEHIKNIEAYDSHLPLTLTQFKHELKKEAFVQYLYKIFLDDDRIMN